MGSLYGSAAGCGVLVLVASLAGCGSGSGGGEIASPPMPQPAMHTVGGTVEGLGSEEVLIVRLNDGDELTLNRDGPFVFGAELPPGTAYTVTAVTGPCDEVEVLNGTGMVSGDVGDVRIVCTGWKRAAEASSPQGTFAYPGGVAIDSAGNALVVYEGQDDFGREQVFVNEFRDGQWIVPVALTEYISGGLSAYDPAVAMSANGDAVIAFTQRSDLGGDYRIHVAHRKDGVWAYLNEAVDSLSVAGAEAYNVSVGMDATGNAVVVWAQSGRIFMAEYQGGAWHRPADLNDNIDPNGGLTSTGVSLGLTGQSRNPKVAMAPNGDAVVVYLRNEIDDRVMLSERRAGVWTHPASIVDAISLAGESSRSPCVDVGDDGTTVVVWRHTNSDRGLYCSEYRDGVWTHPTGSADRISPAGVRVGTPSVTVAPSGNATIAYGGYALVNYSWSVYVSEYQQGVWQHPVDVDDAFSPNSYGPSVVMHDDVTIVLFSRSYGAFESIFVADRRSGVWREPLRLSPLEIDSYAPARLAMNASGQAIAAWDGGDFITERLFVASYR